MYVLSHETVLIHQRRHRSREPEAPSSGFDESMTPLSNPLPNDLQGFREPLTSAMRRNVVHFPPVMVTSFDSLTSITWLRDNAFDNVGDEENDRSSTAGTENARADQATPRVTARVQERLWRAETPNGSNSMEHDEGDGPTTLHPRFPLGMVRQFHTGDAGADSTNGKKKSKKKQKKGKISPEIAGRCLRKTALLLESRCHPPWSPPLRRASGP